MADNNKVEVVEPIADSTTTREYASMNRRLVAAIIDMMIIFLLFTPAINWIIHALFNAPELPEVIMNLADSKNGQPIKVSEMIEAAQQNNAIVPYALTQLLSILAVSSYCVFFWYKQGATIGKILLRIRVIDMKTGNPITFRQSCLRICGYACSALTFCLGFIMINFQKERRGLHDIIASTAVVVCE